MQLQATRQRDESELATRQYRILAMKRHAMEIMKRAVATRSIGEGEGPLSWGSSFGRIRGLCALGHP